MTKKSNFQNISKKARALLSSGESKSVDYKVKLAGLHPDDLVAFANSKNGGTILIGVREISGHGGKQEGEPIGHPIDDKSKLQIMGKALSCSPPIQIEIFVENLGDRAFYRIEIPSGANKPYSTSSGTYKIREDGHNIPLLPEPLLRIFLEQEAAEFKSRFAEATKELEWHMGDTLGLIEQLEQTISMKIGDIDSSLGSAEHRAGDAADTIWVVRHQVQLLATELEKQKQRTKAIALKVGADDPIKQKAEKETLQFLIQKLENNPEIIAAAKQGAPITLSIPGEIVGELSQADAKRLFAVAQKKLESEKNNN